MQSNILAQVEHLLREKKFNIDIKKFIEYLSLVKGKWIYPDAVQHAIKAEIKEIYDVLECLTEKGYFERALEVYCPYCNRYVGQHFNSIFELPEEVHCPHNDCIITNVAENTIIIYRVIKDV